MNPARGGRVSPGFLGFDRDRTSRNSNGSYATTERSTANASRKMPQERAAKTQIGSVVASDKAASTVTCPPSPKEAAQKAGPCPGGVPSGEQLSAGSTHSAFPNHQWPIALSKRSIKGRMHAGSSRRSISQRWRNSSAISAETSRDHPSAVLKLTTRTGFLYWPLSKPRKTVS